MKLNRFYLPEKSTLYQTNNETSLPKELCHKIMHVLKHKVSEKIVIFNGKNKEALCDITAISKKEVKIKILEIKEKNLESPIKIHLAQAITKMNKMEFVLQKATELGVSSITPIITARTVAKIHKGKEIGKLEHWEKIIIAACEQSGRNYIPKLNHPIKFIDWTEEQKKLHSDIINLTLNPKSNLPFSKLKDILKNKYKSLKDFCLLIGPEGGLIDEEIKLTEKSNFYSVAIGPRILRTETAAISSISILQTIFGDF